MLGQAALIFSGILLLSGLGVIVFTVLLSRAPARAIGRIFVKPKSTKVRTEVEIANNPGFDAPPDFRLRLGASAFAPFKRMFRPESAMENALYSCDPGFERGDGKDEGPYDFKNNEEQRLSRGGILFRWINVKPAYVPDQARLNDEIADTYHEVAKKFFSDQVNISADIASMYEDVEGAIIVRQFRIRDRRGFYLLNEFRRTINDNVRKLSFLYSSIMLAVLVGAWFFLPVLNEHAPAAHGIFGWLSAAFRDSLWGLGLCFAGVFLMWLSYYMEYVPNQRNNGREMRSFLTRYMSRLSDRYRDSLANARAVTVGDEVDAAKLSAKATKWNKVVLWMAFRSYFMESYVRNIFYQIGRNCGYYVVWVPPVLTLLVLFAAFVCAKIFGLGFLALITAPGIFFYAGFALMVLVGAVFLIRAMSPLDETNQADWLGYDDLNVDKGMDLVVGKYAEDVGFWKGRLDR